ncbi:MAG: glycine--tRNA ligase subunit beta [Gammaproteobacteria bacterium RIFCSPHIGHO2_12_FULL_38_14]|nr:MAG: glycine--tRNA ligase subunit beta [Gammaproteobacteria bacterium RIFCSPHIGHO2_12_FULL_38_14]
MVDFLFEMGCEELPHSAQETLPDAFSSQLKTTLTEYKLRFQDIQLFSTPRRIGIIVTELQETQAPQKIERFGPSMQEAYDKNGTPTLTCLGFAKSCGVSIDALSEKETPKGKRLVYVTEKPGNATKEILPEIINKVIQKLPLVKPMRWGSHKILFSRPVRWVVMLLGSECIHTEIFGLKTQRETFGHRFHHPNPIIIPYAKAYEATLFEKGCVIADRNKRKNSIWKQVLATQNTSHHVVQDEALLVEITSLVEWPVALQGNFDRSFLSVPKECLITAMRLHQKYFSVVDAHHQLQNSFVMVANITSKNSAMVIRGNERVIRARLSDAEFFYQQDKKIKLSDRYKKLDQIIFQDKLGSLLDKTTRLMSLSQFIAKTAGISIAEIKRAAQLCKCDLMTDMVSEFPNLQGIMGYYYALNDGEKESCAVAIRDHYYPRFSGDELPKTTTGDCLSLADRIDTLVGVIGIGRLPSGDKDPFALRRAAAGVCRILVEKNFSIDLIEVIKKSKLLYQKMLTNKDVISETSDFIMGRLKSHYLDQKVPTEIFESVAVCGVTNLCDFDARLKAVMQFQRLPESSSLSAANKRVSNILKKQKQKDTKKIQVNLFDHEAEKKLFSSLTAQAKIVDSMYKEAQYEKALFALSTLKEPIDCFFDQVMIMTDDKKKRENRLSLLTKIHQLFTKVADISLLP